MVSHFLLLSKSYVKGLSKVQAVEDYTSGILSGGKLEL